MTTTKFWREEWCSSTQGSAAKQSCLFATALPICHRASANLTGVTSLSLFYWLLSGLLLEVGFPVNCGLLQKSVNTTIFESIFTHALRAGWSISQWRQVSQNGSFAEIPHNKLSAQDRSQVSTTSTHPHNLPGPWRLATSLLVLGQSWLVINYTFQNISVRQRSFQGSAINSKLETKENRVQLLGKFSNWQ